MESPQVVTALLIAAFVCFAGPELASAQPCPTLTGIFPTSGIIGQNTNFTIFGSFLNSSAITTTPQVQLITLSNTSSIIMFNVQGILVKLTIRLSFARDCSNDSISFTLYPAVFSVANLLQSTSLSPGDTVPLQGCFPDSCGDGSTNYILILGNVPLIPSLMPSSGLYVGRVANYEATMPRTVTLLVVTQFSNLSLQDAFTLQPRGNITAVNPSVGQRGTRVTIRGNNFLGFSLMMTKVTSVTLGSVPALIVQLVSSNEIAIQVDSGPPGIYDILINTTQRYLGVSGDGPYTYLLRGWTQLPEGVVRTITPPSAQLGANVTLCGERIRGGGANIESVFLNGTFGTLLCPAFGEVFNISGLECVQVALPSVEGVVGGLTYPQAASFKVVANTRAEVLSQESLKFAAIQSVTPNRGQVGTRINISGFELLSGYNVRPTVYLAGLEAVVISYNSSVVVASVPGNQGNFSGVQGDVVVTVSVNNSNYSIILQDSWTLLPSGAINNVTPVYGQYGTIINISGSELLGYGGTFPREVTMGGMQAAIVSYSQSSIVIRAPIVSTPGSLSIIITSDTYSIVKRTDAFIYLRGGMITGAFPNSGQRGTYVTINGTNLFGYGSAIQNVLFGNVSATIDTRKTPSNTSVVVRVERYAIASNLAVLITIISDTMAIVQSSFNWTYIPEGSISGTLPSAEGQEGTRVTILGTNLLGGGISITSVFLDGVNATVVSFNNTAVTVFLGALSARNPSFYPGMIYILSDTGAIVSGGNFTHQSPGEIASFSPVEGRNGTNIILRGFNLIGYGTNIEMVTIAGIIGTVLEFNSSWARVQAGTSNTTATGPIVLIANTGAKVISTYSFTYQTPGVITAVTPNSGTEGTSILILGTNLITPTSSVMSVHIGGSRATVMSQSGSAISVTVGYIPSGRSSGSIEIRGTDGFYLTGSPTFSYFSLNISLTGVKSGQNGTIVNISLPDGQLDLSVCTVTIGGSSARIVYTNVASRTITVAVPRAVRATSYTADVVVTDGRLTARLVNGFTYSQEGVIYDVQPSEGQRGTFVTLTGANLLGNGTSIVFVSLGNCGSGNVISFSNNVVKFRVQDYQVNSNTADIVLSANTGAVIQRLSGFTCIQPGRIESVFPSSGQNGTRVEIRGSRLLQGMTLATNISVTLANVSAFILAQNDSYLLVQAGASLNMSGLVVITLSTGAEIYTNNVMFQYVVQGVVNSISPSAGTVGTVVNISGNNLLGNGSRVVTVLLASGAVNVSVLNSSSTLVTVLILSGPSFRISEPVQIQSDTGAQIYSPSKWSYNPLGYIVSVVPALWQQGVIVNISGLSLIGNATRVYRCSLAGIEGDVIFSSDTSVLCIARKNSNFITGPASLFVDSGPIITSALRNYSYYEAFIRSTNVTSGNNGTYLAIYGAGFQQDSITVTNITIGNVQVLPGFRTISNSTIVARAGYSTASFNNTITVTFSSGAYLQLTNAWDYTEPGEVTRIDPSSAYPGDTVTILGTNLVPSSVNSVQVVVNSIPSYTANIINTSVITFRVGLPSNDINVNQNYSFYIIASNGYTVFSSNNAFFAFNQMEKVSAINPVAGGNGSVVTISGTNLLAGGNITTVRLARINALIINQTENIIIVTASPSAEGRTGNVILESEYGRLSGLSGNNWTYLPPLNKSNVFPGYGQNGTRVTINTSSISSYVVQSVYLAGTLARVLMNTSSKVVVIAGQSNKTSGDVVLYIAGNILLTIYGAFSYPDPIAISSISTYTGYYNTIVTIMGSGFLDPINETTVFLAGVSSTLILKMETQLVLQISEFRNTTDGSIIGPIVISTTKGATYTSSISFTYLQVRALPSSVSPSSGQAGTVVTIRGIRLLAGGTNISQLLLAGVPASVTNASDQELTIVANPSTNLQNITSDIIYTTGTGATVRIPGSWQYRPLATILQVIPLNGNNGTVVTIAGRDLLGGGTSVSSVFLGSVPVSRVVMGTDVFIQVVAGSGQPASSGPITIKANTGATVSFGYFNYFTQNNVTNISPTSGQYNTRVTINGSALYRGGLSRVVLAGVEATIIDGFNQNSITVAANRPSSIGSFQGSVAVVSTDGTVTTSLVQGFTYLQEGTILSVVPSSGQVGTRVSIAGERLLGGGVSLVAVYLAGTKASIVNVSNTLITVIANRSEPLTGDVALVANTGATITRLNGWTYVRSILSSLTPLSGQYGTNVTITGTNLTLGGGGTVSAVLLGNVSASILSSSDSTVVVAAGRPDSPYGSFNVSTLTLIASHGGVLTWNITWTYISEGEFNTVVPRNGSSYENVNITGEGLLGGGHAIVKVFVAGIAASAISGSSDTMVNFVTGRNKGGERKSGSITLISDTGANITVPDAWIYEEQCGVGFFGENPNNCTACHPECVDCTGPGDQNCRSCKNYILWLNKYSNEFRCLERCPVVTNYANDTCFDTCLSNQYNGTDSVLNITFCYDCHPSCSPILGCNGPEPIDCNRCPVGSYLLANGSCASCNKLCSEEKGCEGPTAGDCLACRNGSFLSGNVCVALCPGTTYPIDRYCALCHPLCGARSCTGPLPSQCEPCPNTTFADGSGICQRCHSFCSPELGCIGPEPSDCLSCRNGTVSDSGVCAAVCPMSKYSTGTVCIACETACKNGCTGPGLSGCISGPDAFVAGSGTIALVIVIIIVLTVVLVVLVAVLAASLLKLKKRRYTVTDDIEMADKPGNRSDVKHNSNVGNGGAKESAIDNTVTDISLKLTSNCEGPDDGVAREAHVMDDTRQSGATIDLKQTADSETEYLMLQFISPSAGENLDEASKPQPQTNEVNTTSSDTDRYVKMMSAQDGRLELLSPPNLQQSTASEFGKLTAEKRKISTEVAKMADPSKQSFISVPEDKSSRASDTTEASLDKRISAALDKRKSAAEVTAEERKSAVEPSAQDKRKSALPTAQEKPPPPLPTPKEKPPPPLPTPVTTSPTSPLFPDIELYTDMQSSSIQEVYFNPGQEEYINISTSKLAPAIQQEYAAMNVEADQSRAAQDSQPLQKQTKDEDGAPLLEYGYVGKEDLYEDTDIAVEFSKEYNKRQESTTSLQRNVTLPPKEVQEKAPELPSKGADNVPPALPSRPPKRKSTETALPKIPSVPVFTPPPAQEETYEETCLEECLYEPITGGSKNAQAEESPPSKPASSRKISKDKTKPKK